MAWGDKKEMIAAENVALTREVELLREMIAEHKADKLDLKRQLRHTQDALIAKESPEAYRDKMYAEEQAEYADPESTLDSQRELMRQQGVRANAASRYLQETESPLFKSPEDMIQQLTRGTGVPMAQGGSLHGNEES